MPGGGGGGGPRSLTGVARLFLSTFPLFQRLHHFQVLVCVWEAAAAVNRAFTANTALSFPFLFARLLTTPAAAGASAVVTAREWELDTSIKCILSCGRL